jgi:hypothetical protein
MPDKTESAVDRAVSGLELKTGINLIRGFNATKCMNQNQIRASAECISSADLASVGRDQNYIMTDSNRPIPLKKSAMVSSAEKYASEIEIFTFGRGFRTQISRSSVQKRRFHQSMIRPFGRTDFFNTIGQMLLLFETSFTKNCQKYGNYRSAVLFEMTINLMLLRHFDD